MNNGRTTGILFDIFRRIFSANVYPTGVKLCLKQVCGNRIVKYIKGVFAVYADKFKVVVVIKHLNAK